MPGNGGVPAATATATHTIRQLFRRMQFHAMVSTSPHHHPHYRNCCWFAPGPVCEGWDLQAAAEDANNPATATVSTVSPGASRPPPGCHVRFCSPLALTICIRCLCKVKTEARFCGWTLHTQKVSCFQCLGGNLAGSHLAVRHRKAVVTRGQS